VFLRLHFKKKRQRGVSTRNLRSVRKPAGQYGRKKNKQRGRAQIRKDSGRWGDGSLESIMDYTSRGATSHSVATVLAKKRQGRRKKLKPGSKSAISRRDLMHENNRGNQVGQKSVVRCRKRKIAPGRHAVHSRQTVRSLEMGECFKLDMYRNIRSGNSSRPEKLGGG